MNERQKQFVYELLKDPTISQEQAAINVGYSQKTARTIASKLLTNVHIQDALRVGREAMAKKRRITLERLVEEMEEYAFAKIPDIIEWNDSGVGFRPADKMKALESIGKWTGLIVEQKDLNVNVRGPAKDIESEVLIRQLEHDDETE